MRHGLADAIPDTSYSKAWLHPDVAGRAGFRPAGSRPKDCPERAVPLLQNGYTRLRTCFAKEKSLPLPDHAPSVSPGPWWWRSGEARFAPWLPWRLWRNLLPAGFPDTFCSSDMPGWKGPASPASAPGGTWQWHRWACS